MSVQGGACWAGRLAQVAGTVPVQSRETEHQEHRRGWKGIVLLWPCWEHLEKSQGFLVSAHLLNLRTETSKLPAGIRRQEVTVMQVLRKHGVLSWPCSITVGQALPAHFVERFPSNFFFGGYIKTIFSLTHCPLMRVWSPWTVSVACKADAGCITIASSSVLFSALVVERD